MATSTGLAVGFVSSGRKVDPRWALSLPTLRGPDCMSMSWIISMYPPKDSSINGSDRAHKREEIAEKALEIKAPYLFFLDDDTLIPPFAIRKLYHELANSPNAKVCGGIYCTKTVDPAPMVYKELGSGPFWQWKVGEVFKCGGIGTGAMLIKTDVFEHLSKPWFWEGDKIKDIEWGILPNGQEVPKLYDLYTEDLYFCEKVTKAGFDILAHGGVIGIHVGQDGVLYGLPPDSYPCQDVKNLRMVADII